MKRYQKGWLKKGVALVCGLAIVFSSSFVYADDISDLEEKAATLQNELDALNQDMLTISEEITSTEMQIELTNSEIHRIRGFLEEARGKEDLQYEQMTKRIKFMYETGNASLLETLFSAKNMTDFLNKADFIQNVSDYDRQMLDELRVIREEIASQEENLQDGKRALQDLEKDLTKQKEELEAKAESTSTDLQKFTAELTRLREEERLAEEARKAAEEAERQNQESIRTDGSVINSGGTLAATADDLTILAAIIQCEAYHQYNYMLAVATVILNRVESPRFPNTIRDVVYAPGQFAPTWLGSMDRVLEKGPSDLAYQVAQDALNGARLAEVADCYFFLAESQDVTGVNVGGNIFFVSWASAARSASPATKTDEKVEKQDEDAAA